MHYRRARSWANKRAHASKNRPVNSKAGIYVCSELWKPQGQNIYMKSTASVCTSVYFCMYVYMYCKGVFPPLCVFVHMCNWGQQNSEVSKQKHFIINLWNLSLWQSTSEEESEESTDSHQGYQKSNSTLRWCKALLIFNWGEKQKIPPSPPMPIHHPLPQFYNETVVFPNTVTSPLWGHWSIVWLCMGKVLAREIIYIYLKKGRNDDKGKSQWKRWMAKDKRK